MDPAPNFPWLRYWSLRGDKPTLADDYLVTPEAKPDWFSAGQQADLKTLRELTASPRHFTKPPWIERKCAKPAFAVTSGHFGSTFVSLFGIRRTMGDVCYVIDAG